MERVFDVAQFIFDEYKRVSGQTIDEMKLQKLLYFIQRESLAVMGEPMFDAEFEGWKYGPVCREIRAVYTSDGLNTVCGDIAPNNARIAKNVLARYGIIESWELSKMSHKEISWKNTRKGLSNEDIGDAPLSLADIKKDAQKVRPYDHIWDMYYDEFDYYDEPMACIG